MTIYYVSSEFGSDNNAGTSATAPLASLQAVANLVQPGRHRRGHEWHLYRAAGRRCAGHYHQWYCECPHHLRGRPLTDASLASLCPGDSDTVTVGSARQA
jgi:hypothetical protein